MILAWGPAVFWALVLFSLSEFRTTPSAVAPFLDIPDKLLHFGLYVVLGGFLGWARRVSGTRLSHLFLIGLGCAYAAVDEWHQSFVPGRESDPMDWLADVIGVVAGYLIVGVVLARTGRSRNTTERGYE